MYVKKMNGFVARDKLGIGISLYDKIIWKRSGAVIFEEHVNLTNGHQKNTDFYDLGRLITGIGIDQIARLQIDNSIPNFLSSKFKEQMKNANYDMSTQLTKIVESDYDRSLSHEIMLSHIAPVMKENAKRFSEIIGANDLLFRTYQMLEHYELIGYIRYLYIGEIDRRICDLCESYHGELYTIQELIVKNVIPLLHNNCRCILIGMDEHAVEQYNFNRKGFITKIRMSLRRGMYGLFILNKDFVYSGIQLSQITLPLQPSIRPSRISRSEKVTPKWYEKFNNWAADFGRDTKAVWNSLWSSAVERTQNMFNGIPSFLDWLTMGAISGSLNANEDRFETFRQDPTVYNVANWLLMGVPETLERTVNPDKPFSFDHWMNSLETATIVYSGFKTAKQIIEQRTNSIRPHLDTKPEITTTEDKITTDTRNANGRRQSVHRILTEDEILDIRKQINAIGADENVFRFNEGNRTGYRDSLDVINVRGDVLPDADSIYPTDRMSSKAVLAHEYYGHRANSGTRLSISDWKDEFRASYMAAQNAPGLSIEDQQYLILDAIQRAENAQVIIRYNEFMRRVLYGY